MTLLLSSLSDSCRAQISYWDVPGMRDLLVGADIGTRTPASSRALLIRATPSRYPHGYMQLSAMCNPICTGHGAQSCHIAPAPEGNFLVLEQPPPRAGPCWIIPCHIPLCTPVLRDRKRLEQMEAGCFTVCPREAESWTDGLTSPHLHRTHVADWGIKPRPPSCPMSECLHCDDERFFSDEL